MVKVNRTVLAPELVSRKKDLEIASKVHPHIYDELCKAKGSSYGVCYDPQIVINWKSFKIHHRRLTNCGWNSGSEGYQWDTQNESAGQQIKHYRECLVFKSWIGDLTQKTIFHKVGKVISSTYGGPNQQIGGFRISGGLDDGLLVVVAQGNDKFIQQGVKTVDDFLSEDKTVSDWTWKNSASRQELLKKGLDENVRLRSAIGIQLYDEWLYRWLDHTKPSKGLEPKNALERIFVQVEQKGFRDGIASLSLEICSGGIFQSIYSCSSYFENAVKKVGYMSLLSE